MMGFGFLFGAKDDGAVRMTEDISGGMGRMVDATERVGREAAGIGRLGNFINALNLRQLGRVGDAMENLASRAGALAGEVSSTSMESFGAEYAQTFRAATAGMGDYGAEVESVRGEIGSLAFNLGIGADEMLSYATTVARTGMSLDDFGIDMRSVAGSIQANILSGEQLAGVLTSLARGYNQGAEGATNILNTITALGTQFGVGTAAVQAMPEVLAAVDAAAARFPSIGENVDVAMESITRLGIASQRRLGGTFQEGIQSAINVFNELAGTRREMEGLFTGLNDQFPELASEIARATGSVSLSFDAIMQDPTRFAGTIASMFRSMDQGSPAAARLRAVLEQMGPEFMFLVQGGEESAAALEAAMGSVEGVEGAFNSMSRAAGGSTRTFAESMELVEESFRHSLDRMAQRHYPNFERNVLQRQQRAYQMIGDTIASVAGRGGPVGMLTRSMIAFRRGGFTGLVEGLSVEAEKMGRSFVRAADEMDPRLGGLARRIVGLGESAQNAMPFLDGMGEVLFNAAGAALPAATAMGALGINVDRLKGYAGGAAGAIRAVAVALGPLAIVVAIAAGVYLLVRNFDRVREALSNAGEAVRDFGSSFLQWATDIDWATLGQRIVAGIVSIFTGAGTRLTGMAEDATGAVLDPVWVQMGRNIRDGIRDVFLGIMHAVPGLASGIWTGIQNLFSDPEALRQAITDHIASIGEFLGPAFESAFSTLGDIGGRIWGFLFGVFNIGPVTEAIQQGDWGRAIFEGIIGATGTGFVRRIWAHLFGEEAVSEGLSGISGVFGEIGTGIWDSMMTWVELARPIWNEFMGAFSEIQGVFEELWRDTIQPLFGEIYNEIVPFIEELFGIQLAVGGVGEGFDGIQGAVRGFFEHIQRGWRVIQPFVMGFIQWALPMIVEGVRRWANGVRIAIGVMKRIWSVVGPVLLGIVRGFRSVIETVWEFWQDTLYPILGRIYREVRRVFVQYVLPTVRRVFRFLGRVIRTWWTRGVRPVLGALWARVRTVFGWVKERGKRVFDFLRTHIARRIEQAGNTFRYLSDMWRPTVKLLRTGMRLVGAEIQRYLVGPVVRVKNTLMSLGEGATLVFLRLKVTIMDIFQRIFSGIQELANRFPPLQALLGTSLSTVTSGLTEEIERQNLEIHRREAARARNSIQRLADEARLREASEVARADATEALEAWQDARAEAGRRRPGAPSTRESEAPTREPEEAGATGAGRASSREIRQALAQVPEFMRELTAAGPGLTERELAGIRQEVVETIRGGVIPEDEAVQRLLSAAAEVPAMPGSGVRGAARTRAVEERSRAVAGLMGGGTAEEVRGLAEREEPGGPGRVAARRRGAEEDRRTRETADIAEAMAISEFGSQAIGQMRDAMQEAIRRSRRPAPPSGGGGGTRGTADPL